MIYVKEQNKENRSDENMLNDLLNITGSFYI